LEPITFAETLSYLQQSDVLEKYQVIILLICVLHVRLVPVA